MASPGDNFRNFWTAAFYNQLVAFMSGGKLTASGRATIASSRNGTQLSVSPPRNPVSTLQGILVGGSAPAVADGTTVLDLFAFNAYSIQGAAFILASGTTTLSVLINGSPVSWLDGLAITTSGVYIPIPTPPPDSSHIISPGDQLSISLTGSSGATGLAFSLNCPF